MSVCSIEIILDPSHQPYHAGGLVSGHLNIVPMQEVDAKELIEAAINGMLTSLDPHSGYLPPVDAGKNAGTNSWRIWRPWN